MQLDDLRGWMKGEDCVVVGCGPSATKAAGAWTTEFDERWTICCNRSVRMVSPDFAVCVEPYRLPIWKLIREHAPLIVFSHVAGDARREPPCQRIVKIGSKNVADWLTPGSDIQDLRLGQCPFYAIACAILLGFETIGVIGVDFANTEDRNWPNVDRENAAYGKLATIATAQGSRIINLSPTSRLTSVPQGSWEEVRRKCQTLEKSESPAR